MTSSGMGCRLCAKYRNMNPSEYVMALNCVSSPATLQTSLQTPCKPIYRPILLLSNPLNCYSHCQTSSLYIYRPNLMVIYNIYRPPQSTRRNLDILSLVLSFYIEDFHTLISSVSTSHEFLITGDSTFMFVISLIHFLSLLDHYIT